jgi:hypothetical protein
LILIKKNKNKIKINHKSNHSLPNVAGFKNNFNLKKYMINEGKINLKNKLLNKDLGNELKIPKIYNNNISRNISVPKIYEKHLSVSKTEDIEKQKIDEVKDLINQIVSDFD